MNPTTGKVRTHHGKPSRQKPDEAGNIWRVTQCPDGHWRVWRINPKRTWNPYTLCFRTWEGAMQWVGVRRRNEIQL